MPRLRSPLAPWIAVAAIALAAPPALRAAALAATAGTLFEAVPFVLAAALVPRGRFVVALPRGLALLGCGCGRGWPGALALPALGLCWVAFGPVVALARACAALAVLRFGGRPGGAEHESPDALLELARLGPAALAAALLAEALRVTQPPGSVAAPLVTLASVPLGLLLGLLMPCATGAIAVAAALRDVSPAACIALLASAGIVALPDVWRTRLTRARRLEAAGDRRSGRVAFAVLSAACAALALWGPRGFVNPRFVVPLAAASLGAGALAACGRRTRARYPAAFPALLLGAYVIGSPVPERAPALTTLDDPYPGERVLFTGALRTANEPRHATLVRYTITCCRADAQARAVRLDRPVAGPDGAWYEASGSLVVDDSGYVLHVASIRRIVAPADPFAYR